MVDKRGALADIVLQLEAGDVVGDYEPRDVNPPGAYVHLGAWQNDRLSGAACISALVIVDLVAPDVGTHDAMEQLDTLEALTVAALGPPHGDVVATTLTLPDSTAILPCYRLSYLYDFTDQ